MSDISALLSSTYLVNEDNAQKFTIESRAGLGPVIIATDSINELGSTFFKEKPLLTWKDDDWVDYLNNYLKLSESVKECILNLFVHQMNPKNFLKSASVVSNLERSYSRFHKLGRNTALKLIAIAMANAHPYLGIVTYGYRETNQEKIDPKLDEKRVLMAFQSKLAHSCSPNVVSFRTDDGYFEYRVIRKIKAGDMICMSYSPKNLEAPTRVRRERVFHFTGVHCQCDLCNGPDYWLLRKCSSSTCSEYIPCTHLQDQTEIWICLRCGVLDCMKSKFIEYEAKRDSINCMKRNICPLEVEPSCIKSLDRLLNKIKRDLSPNHYLALQTIWGTADSLLDQAVMIYSRSGVKSMTSCTQLFHGQSLTELFLKGGALVLLYISKLECISAGCTKKNCRGYLDIDGINPPHEPVYSVAGDALMLWSHLQFMPTVGDFPNWAIPLWTRYLPFIKISSNRHGNLHDGKIIGLEKLLLHLDGVECTCTNRACKHRNVHKRIQKT